MQKHLLLVRGGRLLQRSAADVGVQGVGQRAAGHSWLPLCGCYLARVCWWKTTCHFPPRLTQTEVWQV